jgi:hypothetical protein
MTIENGAQGRFTAKERDAVRNGFSPGTARFRGGKETL